MELEKKELTDAFLVAYLSLQGFQITPKKKERLVVFEVSGNGLSEAIEGFYQNHSIPIIDFCKSYRTIRSAIFNLRG